MTKPDRPRSARLSAQGHRQAPGAAAGKPRRQDALSRRLPVRQFGSVHGPAAALVRRASAGRQHAASSSRAKAGSTIRTCARRSRRMATPPSSVSGFEAPVAPRSWGWRWRWNRPASRPSRSTPTCSRGSRNRRRAPHGMPRTRQAYVPQPVVDHLARSAARLYRRHRSGLEAAVHAGASSRR